MIRIYTDKKNGTWCRLNQPIRVKSGKIGEVYANYIKYYPEWLGAFAKVKGTISGTFPFNVITNELGKSLFYQVESHVEWRYMRGSFLALVFKPSANGGFRYIKDNESISVPGWFAGFGATTAMADIMRRSHRPVASFDEYDNTNWRDRLSLMEIKWCYDIDMSLNESTYNFYHDFKPTGPDWDSEKGRLRHFYFPQKDSAENGDFPDMHYPSSGFPYVDMTYPGTNVDAYFVGGYLCLRVRVPASGSGRQMFIGRQSYVPVSVMSIPITQVLFENFTDTKREVKDEDMTLKHDTLF